MTAPTADPRWTITACGGASCRRPIIWARSENGARTPVDAAPSDAGRWLLSQVDGVTEPIARYVKEPGRAALAGRLHVAHWSNCPDRDKYRRPR